MTARILILGCGKMAGAILSGWLQSGWPKDHICVIEASPENRATWQNAGVPTVATLDAVPADFKPEVILLGVKPQSTGEVLPPLGQMIAQRCHPMKPLVLSILAGVPVARYEAAFGSDCPIVRVMPNTPAAVGRGVSGLFANTQVSDSQKNLAEQLMSSVGDVVWLDDEDKMHALTAVSGSGPAYVFHLVEAMAAGGVALGLDADTAMKLARLTVIGSAELLRQSPEEAAQLRRNVTSPGGTTAEALAVMMRDGSSLTEMMTEAEAANAKRSRELAGS